MTQVDTGLATLLIAAPGATPYELEGHRFHGKWVLLKLSGIDDRTQEPWYRGLLLSALVDALEEAGVSVGQTTNLSLASSRRDADLPAMLDQR